MPAGGDDFDATDLGDRPVAGGAGPYLVYRDEGGAPRLTELAGRRLTIGREEGSDLVLGWDQQVSRAHSQIERVGGRWTIVDEGLSRNGTFVNEKRIVGRRPLADGDVIRCGRTEMLFRDPVKSGMETPLASDIAQLVRLSEAQKRVLVALCRPAATRSEVLITQSNREIADELNVSVEAVRTQMKTLFDRFEIPELPPNRKRSELARRALATGVVTQGDLKSGPASLDRPV